VVEGARKLSGMGSVKSKTLTRLGWLSATMQRTGLTRHGY
jgi:hypothetical protein